MRQGNGCRQAARLLRLPGRERRRALFRMLAAPARQGACTNDGKLAFEAKDAADWFAFWGHMRDIKACVPADVQALDQLTIETNMIALRKAAVCFAHSNQFIAIQGLGKEKARHLRLPEPRPQRQTRPISETVDADVGFCNIGQQGRRCRLRQLSGGRPRRHQGAWRRARRSRFGQDPRTADA